MKIAYLDCSSGISGDMCLGALIDAGVSIKRLESELKKVPIRGYKLRATNVKRSGFRATKVDVIQKPTPHPPFSKRGHRGCEAKKWKDIEKIIKSSKLSNEIKEKGLKIFKRLFEAEAEVHAETFYTVHLHELGAVDCIIDILGTLIGIDILEIETVYSSPVNLGSGSIKTAHGILPVPAPATIEILRNQKSESRTPIYSDGIDFELTTPTGAVILKGITSDFRNMPDMAVDRIGIGAGAKDFKDRPNVLRIFIGNLTFSKGGRKGIIKSDETVTIIETNIDDMNPQIYEHVMKKLSRAGALDIYLTQVIMKKGRPGIKLSVLCNKRERDSLMKIIFQETTTIGLRYYETDRLTLNRKTREINTEFGRIRVKVSSLGDKIIKTSPEYEDCKRISKRLNMPLIEIMKKVSLLY